MHKRSTWVAWSMLAIYLVEWILQLPLSVANGNLSHLLGGVTLLVAFTAFMVMGALIVAHQPSNAIGWIFSAIGLLAATGGLAQEYAEYAYITRPGSLPGAILAVWFTLWWWFPTLFLTLVFTLFFFPTGRLLSRRWRPAFWLAASTTAAFTMLAALSPGLDLDKDHAVRNPIGIGWVEDVEKGVVGAGLFVLLSVSLVAALASLVLRFRRSRGEERQQLKWFTYAGALLLLNPLGDFLPNRTLSTRSSGCSSPSCPSPRALPSCATGCTTSTGSSTAPWSMGCSPPCSAPSTPAWSWSWASCLAGSGPSRRAGRSPGPPWPSPPCSSRPAAASNRWLTAASTAASTTRPRPLRRSRPACATRSTSTPSPPRCWRSSGWPPTSWPSACSRCPAGEQSMRDERSATCSLATDLPLIDGPAVRRLIHLRTLHLGPDELLVGAKVEFDPVLSLAEAAEAIDEAERRVRAMVPRGSSTLSRTANRPGAPVEQASARTPDPEPAETLIQLSPSPTGGAAEVGRWNPWNPNCGTCRWGAAYHLVPDPVGGHAVASRHRGEVQVGEQLLTIGIEEEFQIIDADGELKAHIDTLLGQPRRLLILRRGRRARGELPRPARHLTQLPGVDSQVVMGG